MKFFPLTPDVTYAEIVHALRLIVRRAKRKLRVAVGRIFTSRKRRDEAQAARWSGMP